MKYELLQIASTPGERLSHWSRSLLLRIENDLFPVEAVTLISAISVIYFNVVCNVVNGGHPAIVLARLCKNTILICLLLCYAHNHCCFHSSILPPTVIRLLILSNSPYLSLLKVVGHFGS